MKALLDYIKVKKITIIAFLVCAAIFESTLLLFHVSVKIAIYPLLLCAVFALLLFALMYMRTRKKINALTRIRPDEYYLLENVKITSGDLEREYLRIIKLLGEENARIINESDIDYKNMVAYYSTWVHQIKTPISAMKLLLEIEQHDNSRRLLNELDRIEQYVEMVMTYLRLGADSTDYIIKEYSIDEILRPCIKRFSGEFIDRKLTLVYETIDAKVVTDIKWMSFVIEQVLSNALKYTPQGIIKIYMSDEATLCIEDSGIGISNADLPRIFEKGYTGSHGRIYNASGIGLSLCKEICNKLGHEISASSKLGEGTKIYIKLANVTNM